MSFFKRFKIVSTNEDCLNEVICLFSNYENEILNGSYELCLTVEFLKFFDNLNIQLEFEFCEESFTNKFQKKVDKIKFLFKNLISLKINGNFNDSVDVKFNLKYFRKLKSLALENVYLDNIISLKEISHNLTTLKLDKCLINKTYKEFFKKKEYWNLQALCISKTTFDCDDFSFLPITIQSLQLQWNKLEKINLNSFIKIGVNLTELDLSFNKLNKVPSKEDIGNLTETLKVLKLKYNLIKSLKNIECFKNLEVLDLSFNLIIDKNDIKNYLSNCEKLFNLNLLGNPMIFLPNENYNNLFTEMDFFNNLKLNNQRKNQNKEQLILPSNSNQSQENYLNDFQDKKLVHQSSQEGKNKNKKIKQVAVILERSDSSLDLKDNQGIERNKTSDLINNKGLSLGLDNNLSDLQNIIAEQRKSLGKKLISKTPETRVLPTISIEESSKEIAPIKNSIESEKKLFVTEEIKEKVSLKLSNENLLDEKNESLTKKEDNLWADEEELEVDNIFLIDKINSENEVETVFLVVKDSLINEKDCATGRILETYDLNIIQNFDLDEAKETKMTLNFDSKVKSKQKVSYEFESSNQLIKFRDSNIIPYVKKNQEKKRKLRFKYECLKCGTKNSQQNECYSCKSTALIESNDFKKLSSRDIETTKYNVSKSSFKEEFLNTCMMKTDNIKNLEDSILKEKSNGSFSKLDEILNEEKQDIDKDIEDEENLNENQEIQNLITNSLENYNLEQFTLLDHELKLYLEVKIFQNNEYLEHIFECDFSINDTSEVLRGRIVVSNLSLHLISFKIDNLNSTNKVFETFTMQSNKIKNVKLVRNEFFHQCIWLTIEKLSGKKKKKKHLVETQTFFIILKDSKLADLFSFYLENHLNQKELKLKTSFNNVSTTEVPVKLDTEENIVFSQFIVSLITKNENDIRKSSCEDLLCLLFEKNAKIILARCEIIANELKFKTICRNDLSNLTSAKLDKTCKELHLYFSNDYDSLKIEWIIGSYSVNSMFKIIELIKTLWEQIYEIQLQISFYN